VIIALDSSTVLTWILQEQRWQAINTVLARPDAEFVLPGPALTEVVTIARDKGNTSTGEQILLALTGQGIAVAHVEDSAVLLRAAELQESSRADPYTRPRDPERRPLTLSLGDSLILATCEAHGWPVITGDRAWKWHAERGDTTAVVHTY
jgi:PIN domain nuclease of toxin-antitoxin system